MRYLKGSSDAFVGKRHRINRYLICPVQGFFPVLARTGAQSLAVAYRTGGLHMGLSATVSTSVSWDGGISWSSPVPVYPQWEDARNPALGVNSRGELVIAFWKADQAYSYDDGIAKWDVDNAKQGDFTFSCISADSGKTWSGLSPVRCGELNIVSPYGKIIVSPDGTLLMCIYGTSIITNRYCSYVIRSQDGGRTWGDYTMIGESINETALCYAADGSLVAAARTHDGAVCMYYSADHGRTWVRGERVTREDEHPADLTLLPSGRMLMVFGRRIRPYGCGAYISEDNGRTWDCEREALLAGDGVRNGDLGYPSVVTLEDGTIVTAMYFASGSEMTEWGDISAQAIIFREEDLFGK